MTDTPPADARLQREQHLHGAAAHRCSWWRALNRQIRAAAFDDLGNAIERYLLHPPVDLLAHRATRPPDFDRIEGPLRGDASAAPLPLRHSPERRARFLATRATKVENLRNIVRRYLHGGSDSPDESTESQLAQALDELIEWYFWPADEYGTCDGFTPDALELRRRRDCVDVTGYVSVMYYDIPDERWDDSLETLLKGHQRAYLERPFSAELRYEGQSVVHLAAASEEVPWDLCQRLVPTLVGDFVGRCAREIRF